jgi:hypothetical protein
VENVNIVNENKYYILVNDCKLLVHKPWKFIGPGIWQYRERKKAKYSKQHWDKNSRGKSIYSNLKLIEIDVINPEKSKIVKINDSQNKRSK